MSDEDRMGREAPEVSADEAPIAADREQAFRLGGDPPRVMRLSRKALATLGIAAGIGIGGSLLYALRQPHQAVPANLYSTDSRNKADVVTAAPGDYAKVPKLGAPLPGDLGRPILSAQQNGQVVPVPSMGAPSAAQQDPRVAAAEQAHQRVAQERDAARTSRLFLGGATAPADTAMPGGQSLPSTTIAATDAPSATASAPPNGAATGSQSDKKVFLQTAGNRTTVSTERVISSASPDVVQAGSIIAAALLTGIRSDLPGQITAQVTQNVYDSPTGRVLLIPQGARLIGSYDSEVSAGQNRVLLAWDRLILPGGRSILLDRQPGADAAGMAGLQDRTNYHWGNMMRAAAVSTLLGVGTQLATEGDSTLVQALRYGTQDTVNQTGRKLVEREINVPPTLTVRPGYPLRVILTRDLVLEPIVQKASR